MSLPVQPFTPNKGFNLHLTTSNVLDGLVDIVKRFGADHVYESDGACYYVAKVEGQRLIADCIVAQYFADLGVLRILVLNHEGGNNVKNEDGDETGLCNFGMFSSEVRAKLREFGITLDDTAFNLLRSAQGQQDQGIPWGEAVEFAASRMLKDLDIEMPAPPTAVSVLRANADTLLD